MPFLLRIRDEHNGTAPMSSYGRITRWTVVAVIGSCTALLVLLFITLRQPGTRAETYLLPEGFRGPVLVLFRRSDGASPEYESGQLVYRVPSNGVLAVGWSEASFQPRYYFVTSKGERMQIPIDNGAFCDGDTPTTTIVICNMPYLAASKNNGPVAPYRGFVVTPLTDRDRHIASYHALLAQHIR